MHMSLMLGILAAVFCISLFLMCFFRDKLSHPWINPLFLATCTVFFFVWNYAVFLSRGGSSFKFMTLENISPFVFTVILFTPLMAKWFQKYAYAAIAFLGFGMFLAFFISPGFDLVFKFRQEVSFVHITEAVAHLMMALYGFYLILSNKVSLELKDFGKGVAFIYSSVGLGVLFNLVFRQSNFGMNMYGSYSIYFLDIFGSFTATLIAYLIGILATMTLGYLIGTLLDYISRHHHYHKKEQ